MRTTQITPVAWKDHILRFGKYRGHRLSNVAWGNRPYLEWLHSIDLDPVLRKIIDAAAQELGIKGPPGQTRKVAGTKYANHQNAALSTLSAPSWSDPTSRRHRRPDLTKPRR